MECISIPTSWAGFPGMCVHAHGGVSTITVEPVMPTALNDLAFLEGIIEMHQHSRIILE